MCERFVRTLLNSYFKLCLGTVSCTFVIACGILVLAILYHLCNVISFFITYVMYTCYACLVLEYSFTHVDLCI